MKTKNCWIFNYGETLQANLDWLLILRNPAVGIMLVLN